MGRDDQGPHNHYLGPLDTPALRGGQGPGPGMVTRDGIRAFEQGVRGAVQEALQEAQRRLHRIPLSCSCPVDRRLRDPSCEVVSMKASPIMFFAYVTMM